MGIELSLGRCTNRPQVKFGVDGSPISSWPGWLPEVVDLVGTDPIGDIVWIQGERDAKSQTLADAYAGALDAWQDLLHEEWPDARIWVVRLRDPVNAIFIAAPTVRAAQDAVAENIINVDDLGIQGDLTHLNSFALRDLGLRLCGEMAQ